MNSIYGRVTYNIGKDISRISNKNGKEIAGKK